jgi:hypothetical protein
MYRRKQQTTVPEWLNDDRSKFKIVLVPADLERQTPYCTVLYRYSQGLVDEGRAGRVGGSLESCYCVFIWVDADMCRP